MRQPPFHFVIPQRSGGICFQLEGARSRVAHPSRTREGWGIGPERSRTGRPLSSTYPNSVILSEGARFLRAAAEGPATPLAPPNRSKRSTTEPALAFLQPTPNLSS